MNTLMVMVWLCMPKASGNNADWIEWRMYLYCFALECYTWFDLYLYNENYEVISSAQVII